MPEDQHTPTGCSHPYQRTALRRLRQHVSMSVTDIAHEIAAEEYECLGEVPADELEAIERELRQRHIPELAERSYVRHDEDRGVVNLLGRGTDAVVDLAADAESSVDLETTAEETVTIDLSERSLACLHEAMVECDRLDPEMSYDEVVRRLAETGIETE